MELTTTQNDALTELINIGYGRAAAALSELTGYRITLEVPKVSMHLIAEIPGMLANVVSGEVATVNQMFSGPISGTAMLLLEEESALVLTRLLTDERSTVREFDASAREIIIEVGNILLNACLGVFGNLLHVHVSFAVPRLHVNSVQDVLESVNVEASGRLQYGLVIHTRFRLRASDVTGYLVIILGITSLDRMLRELDNWQNQHVT
jgi:chemotaxis protein CheC